MKIKSLILINILLIGGCLAPKPIPPGHKVAARNHLENGIKFLNRGKFSQAEKQFKLAIEKDPYLYEGFFYLGICYREKGEFERAIESFKKAIDLNPEDKGWVDKVNKEIKKVRERRKGWKKRE